MLNFQSLSSIKPKNSFEIVFVIFRSILLEIANTNESVLKSPSPRVRFRSFGDSGLMFQLLFWIEKPEMRGRVIDSVNESIYMRFNSNNIEIPYPHRTVYMKNN